MWNVKNLNYAVQCTNFTDFNLNKFILITSHATH